MTQLYVAVNILKDPPQVMTVPMTLIETEIEIQKMIASPFTGYVVFPDENGVCHGEYMGEEVALIPQEYSPEASE